MSVLGKVLIVLNLLAAGAFTYCALDNWKVRQEIAFTAFKQEVQLVGIPLDTPDPAPTGISTGSVSFPFQVNKATWIESITNEVLGKLIPKGDADLGGEVVPDQTKEVKRVQNKVTVALPVMDEANPQARFTALRTYLLNLARSGAERDGILALFDMLDRSRAGFARRDLPLVGRTASQTAALRALVDIHALADPATSAEARGGLITAAREAVKRLVLGEVAFGAVDDDGKRKLKNAVEEALKNNADDAKKQDVVAAATADSAGFGPLADLAVNPLSGKANWDAARASVLAFVTGRAKTTTEGEALTQVINLIDPPAGATVAAAIDLAATNLLNQKFDEAAAPLATKAKMNGNPAGEKARRIAHLLYHIDAHRADPKDGAIVEARKQWHSRVATIVGMQEYVKAAEAQASEYSDAAQRLVVSITEEQSAFEDEYYSRVSRIRFLHSQWLALVAQVEQQDTITAENKRLRSERETERDILKKNLDDAREAAKVAEEKLMAAQKRLFLTQKELRNAQQALLALEKQLRDLEGVGGR